MSGLLVLTDAGKKYGLGHLSRCLALTKEFESRGFSSQLVINGDADISGLNNARLFPWQENLQIAKGKICVVDSYLLDDAKIAELSFIAEKILWLDDENLRRYNSGVVVNPSLFGAELNYSNGTGLLLGGDYVILREPFRRQFQKEINRSIEEVTVVMGGADAAGLTPVLGAALRQTEQCKINLITSPMAASYEKSLKLQDNKLQVMKNLSAEEMVRVLGRSDVVISAAGQTVYELIQLRVPAVLVAVAENQQRNLNAAARRGLCNVLPEELNFRNLLPGYSRRLELHRNMSLYDFSKGVQNIADGFLGMV